MASNFKVIRGGRDVPSTRDGRRFISGFITSTRLMGVIGMELTWETLFNSKVEKFHQIFYLDAEEFGIESYTQAYGTEPPEIVTERNRLVGALGGSLTPVSEKEARFILQTYITINRKYSQPLPDSRDRYGWLLEPLQTLCRDEYITLMAKACGSIESAYYAINYFMMRTIAADERGAAYLIARPEDIPAVVDPASVPCRVPFVIFGGNTPSTLCRNNISLYTGDDSGTETVRNSGGDVYMCESLVETDNHYRIIVSEIHITRAPFRITDARRCSDLNVSGTEAAMLMDRSEFVTVFDIVDNDDAFTTAFNIYVSEFTETQYENGNLYIDFNNTNDHVNKAEYRINDDIRAMYFMTLTGQLLVIGYTPEAVREAEFRLNLSFLPYSMIINMKYEFREPIVYEFMQSEFDDFESFVDYLGGDEE